MNELRHRTASPVPLECLFVRKTASGHAHGTIETAWVPASQSKTKSTWLGWHWSVEGSLGLAGIYHYQAEPQKLAGRLCHRRQAPHRDRLRTVAIADRIAHFRQ